MIEKIKSILRPFYYWVEPRYFYFLELLFPSTINDYKQIPIIINNRNRLTFLLQLIDSLERRGYKNLFIIDNDSNYLPLLEYYEKCPYHIFRLKENVGFLAFWETEIYKIFIKDFYVYTDSDVVPIDECPYDFMDFFLKVLKKNRFAKKIGFSLKIDDLPDSFSKKHEVIEWEKQFYNKKINDNLFMAQIDTTFALYRPRAKKGATHQTFRTGYPYEARHLPWYVDSANLLEEEKFYIENAKTSTHWTKLNK